MREAFKIGGVLLFLQLIVVLFFITIQKVFTSRSEVRRYHDSIGLTRRDLIRVYGSPWKTLRGSEYGGLAGFAEPSVRDFAEALIFQERYGAVYIYLNEEGKVFWWEFCGG